MWGFFATDAIFLQLKADLLQQLSRHSRLVFARLHFEGFVANSRF